MKNILVPTDFSIYAKYATEAAINLSEKFGATLHLMTCLNIPQWDILNRSAKEKKKYQASLQTIYKTEQLFKEWKQIASNHGVELKTSWEICYLPHVISKFQKEKNIDCIVMGSHGVGQNLELILGSNTQRVIRKTNCPVFVIKSPVEHLDFKNIVFASGFEVLEKDDFDQFLNFIQPFNPKVIHLLKIDTSSLLQKSKEQEIETLEKYKKKTESIARCVTHFYNDYTVDAGIRHFADSIKADLIIISNHIRRPVKRSFFGSNVEDLIRSTELPLLSFDYSSVNKKSLIS